MSKRKEYKDSKTFVISRAKWLRGDPNGPNGESCLLNNEGKMCCLGFYAKKCGFRNQDIKSLGDPSDLVRSKQKKWNSFLLTVNEWDDNYRNSELGVSLMHVNDNPDLSDKVREQKITALFKKAGVKVKFVK